MTLQENNWENPIKGVMLDDKGLIQFSGVTRENSVLMHAMGNEEPFIGTIGENSENENILFLQSEISKEDTHDLIVRWLEFLGKNKELESLKDINKKYKHFHYTTSEIRDLAFATGIFDFCKNWDFETLKRTYYVFKGTYPMAREVLVEIAEKKNKGAPVPTGAGDTPTTTESGV